MNFSARTTFLLIFAGIAASHGLPALARIAFGGRYVPLGLALIIGVGCFMAGAAVSLVFLGVYFNQTFVSWIRWAEVKVGVIENSVNALNLTGLAEFLGTHAQRYEDLDRERTRDLIVQGAAYLLAKPYTEGHLGPGCCKVCSRQHPEWVSLNADSVGLLDTGNHEKTCAGPFMSHLLEKERRYAQEEAERGVVRAWKKSNPVSR